MPVTHVHIEWPDQETDQVYSPSSIIEDYFTVGATLCIDEFAKACNESLNEANGRVRQKFGFACTSAQAELHRISEKCKTYDATKRVKIIAIQ